MRAVKPLAPILMLALSVGMPAHADVAPAPAPVPTVSGTIVIPAGAARAQRCYDDASGANGVFGWILNVTGGAAFTLTTPTPSIDDVNLVFLTALTPCSAAAAFAGSYVNAFGNESGTVPTNATKAIIYVGSTPVPPDHAGWGRPNTPFTYT